MGWVGVMRKPCNAVRASAACASVANSTNAMSVRDGTRRTSCKPGNLQGQGGGQDMVEGTQNTKATLMFPTHTTTTQEECRHSLFKKHLEHHFVGLRGKVAQEEDLVGNR